MPRSTQVINGTEYVFDTDAKWNAEKKYGTHTRTYIGKMVDGIFIPNKRYLLQCALEETQNKKAGSVPVTACSRLFCGTMSGVILFPQQGHGNSPGVQYCFTTHLQAGVKPPPAQQSEFFAPLLFGMIGPKLRSA